MIRIGVLTFLFFGLSAFSHKLVKTKISGDITVSIPEELLPMTPEDLALRYPSVRKPIGAFSDENRAVDFTISTSATQWPDSNLEMAKEFFKSGIYNLYDRVDPIDEGIQEIHKKRYIYFEFDSRINGDRNAMGGEESILKYTYIQYLLEPNRTLVIMFSCPERDKGEWQETAHDVMKSLRIK